MEMEEIKSKIAKWREKEMKHRAKMEFARGQITVYQKMCRHPNQFATSCMGDSGTHCPDCGYST